MLKIEIFGMSYKLAVVICSYMRSDRTLIQNLQRIYVHKSSYMLLSSRTDHQMISDTVIKIFVLNIILQMVEEYNSARYWAYNVGQQCLKVKFVNDILHCANSTYVELYSELITQQSSVNSCLLRH
ncbi:Hypothetical_protein [Hexamita inflata]|uniref:Hypothetical_protein n=1 Tax=Hexamita inflata TaxID=28002 RepID=A0ABP1H4D3_9EUKA